jgi:hypothetical protein
VGTKPANSKDVTHTEVEGQGQIERKERKRQQIDMTALRSTLAGYQRVDGN